MRYFILLSLAIGGLAGCGPSVIDDPGVSLPAELPEPTYSQEAIDLNNQAGELMIEDEAAARALFDKAIALDPKNPMPYTNKASLLLQQQEFAPAAECFEKLAQLRPHSAECYVGWAYCLHRLGKPSESRERLRYAIAAYNERLTEKPADPQNLIGRAMATFLYGEPERAQQEIAQVIAANPESGNGEELAKTMREAAGPDNLWKKLFP